MPLPSASQTIADGAQQVDVAVVGAGFAGLYLLHPPAPGGLHGAWRWKRPTMSAAPGTGTAIPVHAATSRQPTTASPSIPSWRRRGNGRRSTPRSPRSCAIWASSPTATTCGATSASPRGSRRRRWDEATERWLLATSAGASVSCRCYIMASGCLSEPKPPEIDGVARLRGRRFTSPVAGRMTGVDFTGKRVAVIGTGSSGIQAIPLIAEQAAHLTVFQRTPNFAFPGAQRPAACRARRSAGARPRRLSGAGAAVADRRAAGARHRVQLAVERGRTSPALRAGAGGGRPRRHAVAAVGRPGRRPRGQCARGRSPARIRSVRS